MRDSYGAFHTAIGSLYEAETLDLAADERPPVIDAADFHAVAEMIYNAGGFKLEQIKDPRARKLIQDTVAAINTGVRSSLPVEVPDTLRYPLEENGFIFSGFKTFHAMREVGLSMVTDNGEIKPFGQFRDDVQQIHEKYNVGYLHAEYKHAVGAAQMAAKWDRMQQDGDRYLLQYRTAGDGRVRPDHYALEGITLPPSDPFWSKYYPPNGWGCRCTAVQVRREKYPESDPSVAMQLGDQCTEQKKQQIFRYNPGKELQLFPPKHPYYKAPKTAEAAVFEAARYDAKKNAVEITQESDSLETGVLHMTPKATKRAVGETRDREQLNALFLLPLNLDKFQFQRFSPLGEGKDLDNPKHKKNVEQKRKRGVIGYNVYETTLSGVTWVVKTEVFRWKEEAIYHIMKK